MATQIFGQEQVFGVDDAIGFHPSATAGQRDYEEASAVARSPFRGLFYVILFDVLILLAALGMWELWRYVR